MKLIKKFSNEKLMNELFVYKKLCNNCPIDFFYLKIFKLLLNEAKNRKLINHSD